MDMTGDDMIMTENNQFDIHVLFPVSCSNTHLTHPYHCILSGRVWLLASSLEFSWGVQ
jgi:hypothetical protein